MKSKLIKELLGVLTNVKAEQGDVTLDITEDNKESVYSELLIPLMNLTNADTVEALCKKLDFLINGNVDSAEYSEFAGTLVNYILDDEESNANFSEELESLIVNCMATLNALGAMKTGDNKEDALASMNAELIDLINLNKTESDVNEADKAEAGNEPVTPDEDPDAVPVEPDPDTEPVEPDETSAATTGFVIVPAAEEVDETPWGEINKVELKNALSNALSESEDNKAVIDEVFALVKSYDKPADWQWPHHIIKEDKIVLNVNGVKAAALFLLKPNSSKNLTTDERTTIAKHLLKHYKEIEMESPDKLTNLANGKESTIILNIKDDELQEFGEMFKVNAEDIGTYVGLVEALLTDLVNGGIINIENESSDFDESVIAVKLDKSQVEEFIKYFDIMSDDVVSILANDLDSLSYKQTDTDLANRYNESHTQIDLLNNTVTELNRQLQDQKQQLEQMATSTVDQHLVQTKFQAIVDFIKSSTDVDETILQFINNVIEAESGRDIQYMAKIGKSFMKSAASSDLTKFVKKSSILRQIKQNEVNDLLNLVDGDKQESTKFANVVNKRVDQLSSYLD